MNNTQTDTITALSQEILRGKIVDLSAREQDLIRRAQAAYASGDSSAPPAQHVQQRHDRARQILNGAGTLLKPLDSGGDTDVSLQAELSAVRLALEVLNRASIERQGIEDAEWAVENTTAWRAKVRKFVLAMVALIEADAECTAFLNTAGGGRAAALPFGNIHGAYAGIEFRGWMTLKQAFDAAVDEGVVKASELKVKGAHDA